MEIEIGIPVPEPSRPGRPRRWPVYKLKPNESVFCKDVNMAHSVRYQIRELGGRAAMRKQEGGYRVWRIS